MSEIKYLKWDITDHIATVRLARPPVNAFVQEMYVELRQFFENAREYLPDTRAIVLTGEGKHFCAGNDLREFPSLDPDNSPARMENARNAFWALRANPIPTVAAVSGAALGTGLAIAASCDLVVASDDAKFGLPEVNVGLLGGAKHASRLVPQQLVRYLHLTGENLTAEEVARYGGVLKVVPRAELMGEAYRIARLMARHSPLVLEFVKRSLNEIEYQNLYDGYRYEQTLSGEFSTYSDAKEAVNAVLEKRSPVYTGT
ncbi:enoyl-CoA hydratase-related protein (plasmid) [Pseudonocardia bannensis]|uniref:Crotonase n=1 Tax=Pseudonocardia bannensis TaxID=630973 RepID=A0A848DIC3_9PSEU|nr:enoyl-CoA hydratase-related protein [Pseudonocardia bannensis]NMH92447.1 crotonase [Pseudonocardia bannensis]